ncbi:MAG: hypothetical protein ACRCYV_09465 [Aeromonas sp.]
MRILQQPALACALGAAFYLIFTSALALNGGGHYYNPLNWQGAHWVCGVLLLLTESTLCAMRRFIDTEQQQQP